MDKVTACWSEGRRHQFRVGHRSDLHVFGNHVPQFLLEQDCDTGATPEVAWVGGHRKVIGRHRCGKSRETSLLVVETIRDLHIRMTLATASVQKKNGRAQIMKAIVSAS